MELGRRLKYDIQPTSQRFIRLGVVPNVDVGVNVGMAT